jgi:prepilin-type N-terminal cleavage/methylation domain-containing protein
MPRFSQVSETVYNIQQLMMQPATRRTASAATIGFTIVELLIVIVVIGILAAIVIVAYNGVQNSANDASVRSDLGQFLRKYEEYKLNDPAGLYPRSNAQLGQLGIKITNKNAYASDASALYNLLNCSTTANQGSDYALLAITKSGKKLYVSSSSGGVTEYTGSASWAVGSNLSTMCGSVMSGTVGGTAAGYSSNDGWRSWTN